jgi:hypothetical protein
MENDKSKASADDFDELADDAWDFAFNHSDNSKPLQAWAILTESSERLKRATEENREAIDKLRVSTEESSRQANRLSARIKNLTGWLVGLTTVAVVLTALSLYVLFISAK